MFNSCNCTKRFRIKVSKFVESAKLVNNFGNVTTNKIQQFKSSVHCCHFLCERELDPP